MNFASVHQRHSFEQNNSIIGGLSAQGIYKEQAIQLRSNNSLEHSITNTSHLFPKQSRQQQMYNSIISNAVRKSAMEKLDN